MLLLLLLPFAIVRKCKFRKRICPCINAATPADNRRGIRGQAGPGRTRRTHSRSQTRSKHISCSLNWNSKSIRLRRRRAPLSYHLPFAICHLPVLVLCRWTPLSARREIKGNIKGKLKINFTHLTGIFNMKLVLYKEI